MRRSAGVLFCASRMNPLKSNRLSNRTPAFQSMAVLLLPRCSRRCTFPGANLSSNAARAHGEHVNLVHAVRESFRRLSLDESGQDLIEYALLATVIGLVGVLAFQFFATTLQVVYQSWDTATQNSWEQQPPVSGGS